MDREPTRNLPVPVAPAVTEPRAEEPARSARTRATDSAAPKADASFSAHVMGQGGIKRGLRGGDEVLKAARSTYLGAEYSGSADRRPKPGIIRKTEI